MSLEISVVETTGPDDSVNLGSVVGLSGTVSMKMRLLSNSAPDVAPINVATIHLSASASTTPGVFLTPNAPTFDISCDPSLLWLSVHGEDEFVQILAQG